MSIILLTFWFSAILCSLYKKLKTGSATSSPLYFLLTCSIFFFPTNTTFSIETKSGAIPDLPKVVNVFKYVHETSLTALDDAKIIAEKLDFEPEKYARKSTTEYRWTNTEKAQTLTIETGNLNFHLKTNFSKVDPSDGTGELPSEENAKTLATEYLQSAGLMTKDYSEGFQRTYLVKLTPDKEFSEAPSLSEADLIRVDFFRKDDLITVETSMLGTKEVGTGLQEQLEKEKTSTITNPTGKGSIDVKQYSVDILNDSPYFGNISVYLGASNSDRGDRYTVYQIDYVNWLIAETPCGTYGLVSPQEAVQKVQDGKATLAYLMEQKGDRLLPSQTKNVKSMTILDVGLGFLDQSQKESYLQPIYYIKGEAKFQTGAYGEFYYYIPAIDYEAIPEDAGTTIQTDSSTKQ